MNRPYSEPPEAGLVTEERPAGNQAWSASSTLPNQPESEEAAKRAVGRTLARKYKLHRLIGVGGMGAVYEAEHLGTHRPYAIKTLHEKHAGSAVFAERFLREARAASRIGHRGIVKVYDSGVDEDGLHYLVLELLQGKDLGEALRENELTLGDVWRIGVEVLDALAAAHAAGIIHRDIKPENVFLIRQGDTFRVKLLDFGIAKTESANDPKLTVTGTVLGTPHYMSPEQAAGDSIDPRADLWAVGAMLFRLLAGFPPHDAENYNVLISRILTELPPKLVDVRPELPRLFHHCVDGSLRPQREERFKSAEAMLAVLAGRADLSGLARGAVVAAPYDWARLPLSSAELRHSDPSPAAPDFDDAPTEAAVPAFLAEAESPAIPQVEERPNSVDTAKVPRVRLALQERPQWFWLVLVAIVAFGISLSIGLALR